MFSVALIGPDGAGKTTIGQRLVDTLPLPVKYVYMGVNRDSSNHMLPTTRLLRALRRICGAKPDIAGPRDPRQLQQRPKSWLRRAAAGVKSTLSLLNRMAEECYRQGLAWYYQRRQYIVLFDRHYYSDYYAYDIAGGGERRALSRRIHGFFLERLYPKPDLVIYLDAPAEVLLARKGEGSLEVLEQRRQDYLAMRDLVRHFAVVDASRPRDEVAGDVTRCIWEFYQTRSVGAVRRAHHAA